MRKYTESILIFLVNYFGASVLSLLISMIPLYISRSLTKDTYVSDLVYFISIMVVMLLTLFFLNKRQGYNKNNGHDDAFRNFLISGSLALLLYTAIGFTTKFFMLLYAQVNYASIMYIYKDYLDIVQLQTKYFNVLTVTYILTLVPLLTATVMGFHNGCKKRMYDRKKIMEETK
ncbi:MAG: hypothetical protein AB9835_07770 [Eubacteriales bacterium]